MAGGDASQRLDSAINKPANISNKMMRPMPAINRKIPLARHMNLKTLLSSMRASFPIFMFGLRRTGGARAKAYLRFAAYPARASKSRDTIESMGAPAVFDARSADWHSANVRFNMRNPQISNCWEKLRSCMAKTGGLKDFMAWPLGNPPSIAIAASVRRMICLCRPNKMPMGLTLPATARR